VPSPRCWARGGIVQVDESGAPDAAFTVCRTYNRYRAWLKDGVKRGKLVSANIGEAVS
jgi:hypothetical protein